MCQIASVKAAIAFEPKVAGKISTIPNGVDIAMFASGKRDRDRQFSRGMKKYNHC